MSTAERVTLEDIGKAGRGTRVYWHGFSGASPNARGTLVTPYDHDLRADVQWDNGGRAFVSAMVLSRCTDLPCGCPWCKR